MALPNLEALLEEKKLPGLDGFRMVVLMAVVLAHSGGGALFFSARHGVAGFIALSGVLVTWLALKGHKEAGNAWSRNFDMRRSLKIIPAYVYYALLLVSLVIKQHWLSQPVPIYLWHVWGLLAGDRLGFLSEWLLLSAGVMISSLVALASYHFFERRSLRLKQRYEAEVPKSDGSSVADYLRCMNNRPDRERCS